MVSREAGSGTRSSFEQIVGGINLTRDAHHPGFQRHDPRNRGQRRERDRLPVARPAEREDQGGSGRRHGRARTRPSSAGEYKLVRPIFLLTKGEPAGCRQGLHRLHPVDEGQKVIKANGLIPAK